MNDDELNVLRFKVSNLTTEKEVANAEIDRLKGEVTRWQKVSEDDDVVLAERASQLAAERESKVAARGEVDRLRKQIGALNLRKWLNKL